MLSRETSPPLSRNPHHHTVIKLCLQVVHIHLLEALLSVNDKRHAALLRLRMPVVVARPCFRRIRGAMMLLLSGRASRLWCIPFETIRPLRPFPSFAFLSYLQAKRHPLPLVVESTQDE